MNEIESPDNKSQLEIEHLLETIDGVIDVYLFYLNPDTRKYIKRHRSRYNLMDRWIMAGDIEARLLQIEAELKRLELQLSKFGYEIEWENFMANDRQFHSGIRVQQLHEGRTGHAHLLIWTGLAPSDDTRNLRDVSRGQSTNGHFIIDADAAPEYIESHLGIVRLEVWHEVDAPKWLQDLYCKINKVDKFEYLAPANFGL